MKLFFGEILSGSSFEIEVDKSDTLLLVKQKIEKSQNIPVSKQFLAVNGVVILRDDLNVEQCQIVQESRLQVFISPEQKNPNHNNDQVIQTSSTVQFS
ncbi:Ubiquitin domain-containing protein 7SL RNA1 [Cardamine amara subsp. amara]|uniref:Ubiquitin domain-containing protein 7SL RNA1 n=1 Tax=Cardamine amara subsp. amara TaxID=228776 RepID=A0ABD0Z0U8_CARAN